MATETASPAYEPATQYKVTLARPVTVFGAPLLPLHEHEIVGDVLNLIVKENGADAVAIADPIR